VFESAKADAKLSRLFVSKSLELTAWGARLISMYNCSLSFHFWARVLRKGGQSDESELPLVIFGRSENKGDLRK
jgi:hypothetical protein